ncbi:MAG: CoA transferase subunit A [Armatimonadetes bacterium]|nr:CoA transferase subunit A [Armatimonadota bacterium]
MNKLWSIERAIAHVKDGMLLMMGGFGLCGIPENLIRTLLQHGARDLTIVSNNAGVDDFGIGLLINNGQVKKMISSYIGENRVLEQKIIRGEIEVELNPQGTLAERIRAGGAGIAAFYTPTGVGTTIAEGKETRVFNDRKYVLETALRADVAFVKAFRADKHGNLTYRRTARNFNPMMATAAELVIAEAEEVVEPGQLQPDAIVTPGVFVDAVIQGEKYEKRIEKRTNRPKSGAGV